MPDLIFENNVGRLNGAWVCGADEVGRGPLAGPVVAAAVIIPVTGLSPALQAQVQDSKKLTPSKREQLAPEILATCPHAIAMASVQEIDQINILQASLLAMRRAIDDLAAQWGRPIDHALIDGNKAPSLSCPVSCIVKGDDKSLSIAAASVIAKVRRDSIMADLAAQYPAYGWDRNAGYPTAEHLAALAQWGPSPHHRMTFAPLKHMPLRRAG